MLTLTLTEARRLAITCQRLAGPAPTSLLEVIRALRCLQLDPIRAVERTQYLVLWSRLGAYAMTDLDDLLWQKRQLFEYWAHAASIVLTEDYPIHQVLMRQVAQGQAWARLHHWAHTNEAFHRHLLEQFQQRGALAARELEDMAAVGWQSDGWTSGRNVSRMLDFMWTAGEIMVAARRGLHKKWALTATCFPEWAHLSPLTEDEAVYQAVPLALRALGVATLKQLKNHFIRHRYPQLKQVVTKLLQDGLIIEVVALQEEGQTYPGPWYLHSADVPVLEALRQGAWQPRTTLLSPFDNLICDRQRTELLWDFYFRLEIYVPVGQRQYGYYVLPILHGDQLIGRIDPYMERKTGTLHLKAIYAEANAPQDPATGRAVTAAIESLATFLGATQLIYHHPGPAGWQLG